MNSKFWKIIFKLQPNCADVCTQALLSQGRGGQTDHLAARRGEVAVLHPRSLERDSNFEATGGWGVVYSELHEKGWNDRRDDGCVPVIGTEASLLSMQHHHRPFLQILRLTQRLIY
jgi:hypothetical protein